MFTSTDLLDLHRRTHASLEKILVHLAGFPLPALHREMEGFGYPTLLLQVHHVLGAERYWIGVLQGRMLLDEDDADRSSLDAVRAFRDLVLSPSEVRDLGEVAFPEPLTLAGRLLDAQGSPVRDAAVRLEDWWCESRVRTDPGGGFRLERVPPGRSTLRIEASPLAVTFVRVDLRSGLAPLEVRLPAPGTLRVRVARAGGETLPKAPMDVVRLLDTGVPDEDRRVILETDSRGVLETELPPGPYGVAPHPAAGVQVLGEAPRVMIRSERTTEVEIHVR